jgi:hypothetical protein
VVGHFSTYAAARSEEAQQKGHNLTKIDRDWISVTINAGLKELIRASLPQDQDLVEFLRKELKLTEHCYRSTACLHNMHAACRVDCKYCGVPCVCCCHKGA